MKNRRREEYRAPKEEKGFLDANTVFKRGRKDENRRRPKEISEGQRDKTTEETAP